MKLHVTSSQTSVKLSGDATLRRTDVKCVELQVYADANCKRQSC